MRVAIPLWNDSVSPVLDTAGRIVVVDIDEARVVSRQEISLTGVGPQQIADIIANHTNILVCGALSRMMSIYLESRGVTVYPWTMGNVDRIIEIFTVGDTPGPEFTMPGCKRHRYKKCNRKGWFKDSGLHK